MNEGLTRAQVERKPGLLAPEQAPD